MEKIVRILMPASGHQDDHDDSVHIQFEDGRIACGRAYSPNLHTKTDKPVTCERCNQIIEQSDK